MHSTHFAKIRIATLVALVLAGICAVAQSNPASASAGVPSAEASSAMLISTGDLLAVSIFGVPDYRPEVRVAGSGEVSLPLVGPVHVAGNTVNQAQHLIAKSMM